VTDHDYLYAIRTLLVDLLGVKYASAITAAEGAEASALADLAQASYLSVNDRRLHFGLGGKTRSEP
jgi:hypothetical protein